MVFFSSSEISSPPTPPTQHKKYFVSAHRDDCDEDPKNGADQLRDESAAAFAELAEHGLTVAQTAQSAKAFLLHDDGALITSLDTASADTPFPFLLSLPQARLEALLTAQLLGLGVPAARKACRSRGSC